VKQGGEGAGQPGASHVGHFFRAESHGEPPRISVWLEALLCLGRKGIAAVCELTVCQSRQGQKRPKLGSAPTPERHNI
jgi:hypothetical protein